jgi:hypothetical protein
MHTIGVHIIAYHWYAYNGIEMVCIELIFIPWYRNGMHTIACIPFIDYF